MTSFRKRGPLCILREKPVKLSACTPEFQVLSPKRNSKGLSATYDSVESKNFVPVEENLSAQKSISPRQLSPERCLEAVAKPEPTKLSNLNIFSGTQSDIETEKEWRVVREHLLREGRLEESAAISLITRATTHLAKQPNLLELSAPIVICGDIHGQFFDLCNLLDTIGDPKDTKYLFLGDYVDRGDFSTEVCFLLFSIMLSFPDNFYLIRGNHESRLLTNNFNFKIECFVKYSEKVYNAFINSFDCLPLAATISTGDATKRYFCCHGGLSPDLQDVSDILSIDRFIEPPEEGLLCDLLWSDPLNENETDDMFGNEIEMWNNTRFRYNEVRGCSYEFGPAAIDQFLRENNFTTIIRAHEVKRMGYEEHFKPPPGNNSSPKVITVFSAPNYCDMYENQAGYLSISSLGKIRPGSITWTSHPYWLPDFEDALTFSMPFIDECMANLFLKMVEYLGVAESEFHKAHEGYKTIAHKRRKKKKRIQMKKTLTSGKDAFRRALQRDHNNEKRPHPHNVPDEHTWRHKSI